MDDGTVLLADRWVAESARDEPQPTVLVRSCYGRGGAYGLFHGRMLAERGLQAVIQSVRGTFGSEGTFNPLDERADGLATLRWLREQPWHEGPIGMTGESYLGLVQWAVAADADDDLKALSIQGSASQFHGQSFPGGSMSLETSTQWMVMTATQERGLAPLPMLFALFRLPSRLSERSLRDLDRRTTGGEVGWFREALSQTERNDAWWVARDFSDGVGRVKADVQMVTGWYDAFLPWQLEDYAALQEVGRAPQLVIGPWSHVQEGLVAAGVREGLAWLRGHLLDDWQHADRSAVRVYVTGEGAGWRELERWPPAESGARRLWPAAGGRLAWNPPDEAAGDSTRYRYDPADPTPSVGGPIMITAKPVRDNRKLEARPDVVTFTSEPLDAPLAALGPVRVELSARASEPYRSLRSRVRRRPARCLPERHRRPGERRSGPVRALRGGRLLAGRVRPVADRAPVRGRASHPPAGLLGSTPALRAEPGHRRAPARGGDAESRRRRDPPRAPASVGGGPPDRLRTLSGRRQESLVACCTTTTGQVA
jgi:putative CocE/NonD family hydrolase